MLAFYTDKVVIVDTDYKKIVLLLTTHNLQRDLVTIKFGILKKAR